MTVDPTKTANDDVAPEDEAGSVRLYALKVRECSPLARAYLAQLDEIERLRGLVTRLTGVASDLAAGTSDPGTEALAAIYCGKNFIYG